MYEDEMMNEVVENNETTMNEVVSEENYAPAPVSAPTEIILPETPESETGPNKVLIAAAVAGGLFLANKARKKLKPAIEKRKAKKAEERKKEILDVLIANGVVPAPEEAAKDDKTEVIDVPATEVKTESDKTETSSDKKEEKEKK